MFSLSRKACFLYKTWKSLFYDLFSRAITWGCSSLLGLQVVTGGYKGFQGVMGGYKGLQGLRKDYRKLVF